MTNALEGGCLCGAVRYRISADPLAQSLCHCRSCRLAAGASPVAWLVLPTAGFSFTLGEPIRFKSSSEAERTFCGTCGTALTYRDSTSLLSVDVTACSLDRPAAFVPTREIWVTHRLPWLPPLAGLAQFEEGSSRGA